MRRSTRGALSIGVAVLAAGCGGDSAAPGDEAGDAFKGEPVGELVAGDDAAWILTSPGARDDDIAVWRLALDASRPERVGEVPGLQGARAVASSEGLDVAGWRCAADCSAGVAVLTRLDDRGDQVDEVVLYEKPGPLEDSDSVAIAGTAGGSVWVAVHGTVVEVGDDGEVRSTVPTSGGEPCVIDGELYGLVDPTFDPPTGTAPVVITSDDAAASPGESRFSVVAYEGGWRPVDERAATTVGRAALVGLCADGRYEVVTDAGALIASWTPTSGWVAAETPADRATSGLTDDRFAQVPGGRISERTADGTWEPTGLTLPAPPASSEADGPAALAVDSSERLVAGCVSWPTGDRERTTTCDAAVR